MKNKTIHLRISDTLLERFDETLEKEGVTRSHVLTEAIREYIQNHREEMKMNFWEYPTVKDMKENKERFIEVAMDAAKRAKDSVNDNIAIAVMWNGFDFDTQVYPGDMINSNAVHVFDAGRYRPDKNANVRELAEDAYEHFLHTTLE